MPEDLLKQAVLIFVGEHEGYASNAKTIPEDRGGCIRRAHRSRVAAPTSRAQSFEIAVKDNLIESFCLRDIEIHKI